MDMEMDCGGDPTAGGSGAPEHLQNRLPPPEAFPPQVASFLAAARQLVGEGKPSLALQAVVMAVKAQGGDDAVFDILQRARTLYQKKLQATAAADELAHLFAECAIAEAHSDETIMSEPSTMLPSNHNLNSSILAESGRNQIVLEFYQDGSSFVCLQCGGLVSNQRRDEHFAYWCCGQT